MLAVRIKKQMPLGALQHWNDGTFLHPIRDRALSRLGISSRDLAGQISRYAGKTIHELFAEAFADTYTNKDNASEASKILTEELIRELRS